MHDHEHTPDMENCTVCWTDRHKHFFRFAYRSIGSVLVFYCDCEGEGSIQFMRPDYHRKVA